MSKQVRRLFTAVEKVAIVRQVLLEKRLVSEVCEEHNLQPTLYYAWQRQFFENGAVAFEKDKPKEAPGQQQLERQIEKLEHKVRPQHAIFTLRHPDPTPHDDKTALFARAIASTDTSCFYLSGPDPPRGPGASGSVRQRWPSKHRFAFWNGTG